MSTPNLPKPSPKFLPSRQTLRKHKTSIRRALSRDKLLLWMVVVPMLFSMVYFVILAKDRYVSESLAVVKRADDSSAVNLTLSSLVGGGSATVKEDALLLQQYILSPDMFKKLDQKLDLKQAFAKSGLDLLQRLPQDAVFEDAYQYYLSKVSVSFDDKTGVLTIRTQGFGPTFARQFNQAVLTESEVFLNELSQNISRTQIKEAQQDVTRTYAALQAAERDLLQFQNKNRLIDPQIQIEATSKLVAELQAKKAQLEADRNNLRTYLNDGTPQIKAAQSAIDAIDAQIKKEESKLTSSDNKKLNEKMLQFTELKSRVAFAGDLYKLALTSLEKSRAEINRTSRVLAVVSQPTQADLAYYPRTLYSLATILLISLLLYGFAKVVVSIIRDHRI